MSDLPQQDTIIQYVADGVTNEYVFAFYVPQDIDIAVYVTLEDATPIPEDDIQELGVDYTVSHNVDPITGGTVIFAVGHIPPLGSTITFSRDIAASLNVEFSDAQNFSGQNLDNALDRLLLLIQQNKTYALQRNLSYRVNSYLPSIEENTQVQPLQPNYIWMGGPDGGVITALLEENPDVSTLRSELANDSPGTDGARLVGYYDSVNTVGTTVRAFLANLSNYIVEDLLLVPVGVMPDFAGTVAPAGWLLCDGTAVSRTTYARLFAVIGEEWGPGDASTTFNLPDFRRRTPVGSGGSGTATLGNAVGDVGGSETNVLAITNMPAHTHPGSLFSTANVNCGAGGTPVLGRDAGTTKAVSVETEGNGTAHNIMQPSAVVLKIIKY